MSIHIVDHPLAQDALVTLRDKRTTPEYFRRAATQITVLLAAEALRHLPTSNVTVETPIGPADGRRIATDIVVVPILRAGLGMLDAVLELAPSARVGHIGLQRNETTAIASQYYAKLPSGVNESVVLLIDPMLATGGSAVAALDVLRRAGATRVSDSLHRGRARVCVWSRVIPTRPSTRRSSIGASITRVIHRSGLGDFGDRLYGTL